jgi:Fe2+ transport system protein B
MHKIGISCTPKLKKALEEIVQEAKNLSNTNNSDNANAHGEDAAALKVQIQKMEEILSKCINHNQAANTSANADTIDDAGASRNTKGNANVALLGTTNPTIPLNAITIAKELTLTIDRNSNTGTGNDPDQTQAQKLNQALQNTSLQYPPRPSTAPSKAYQERIAQLKLKEQERKYSKLTSNVNKVEADDATLKSMMYAASIGANMIVAPISIGVLMYFFAGKLFAFVDPDYESRREEGKMDIRGVIAGVVAGVIMLFIEMILFVIRNHEMDRFVTKKMKANKKNPFGYDKTSANRTYTGELG